jgi:hypothetical protein
MILIAWDIDKNEAVKPERLPLAGEYAFNKESNVKSYFHDFDPIIEPSIRNITKGAFRSRLTPAEQAAFMGLLLAGNIAINVIDGTLRDTSHVDLDDLETIYSANALESEGVLKTSDRVQELLNDGIESERFKG